LASLRIGPVDGDIFSTISSKINQNLSTIIEQQKQGLEEQKIFELEKQREQDKFQTQQQRVSFSSYLLLNGLMFR
jgi:hypothetical protein